MLKAVNSGNAVILVMESVDIKKKHNFSLVDVREAVAVFSTIYSVKETHRYDSDTGKSKSFGEVNDYTTSCFTTINCDFPIPVINSQPAI